MNLIFYSGLIKILFLYLLNLLLYFNITSNHSRFIFTLFLYLFSIIMFKIDYKDAVLFFIIAICCSITEYFFIRFINHSWDYRKPDLYLIPYWLIPLWAIAVVIITEIVKLVKYS